MDIKKLSIVLTGGGTAGHVLPHFALFEGSNSLSEAFQNKSLEVYYIGSYEGMERSLVAYGQPQWEYYPIFTGKLRRYFSWRNFIDPFKIMFGFIQSFFLLGNKKPSVVFSKGGFVSVPAVWCAWLRRIPVIIHESDVTPALATKLTLPFAKKALFAFEETLEKIPSKFRAKAMSLGLPIRNSLFQSTREQGLQFFKFSENKKVILIFGGSLGAQSLNQKVFEMLPSLLKRYQIVHITGKGNKKTFEWMPEESEEFKNYRQYEFLNEEMKYAYAVANLAVCRAGANSIFELAAGKIPMILFPLGLLASRGDQIVNAKIFAGKGWAQWVDESSYSQQKTMSLIDSTMDNLESFKEALLNAPSLEAANTISELIWSTILKK